MDKPKQFSKTTKGRPPLVNPPTANPASRATVFFTSSNNSSRGKFSKGGKSWTQSQLGKLDGLESRPLATTYNQQVKLEDPPSVKNPEQHELFGRSTVQGFDQRQQFGQTQVVGGFTQPPEIADDLQPTVEIMSRKRSEGNFRPNSTKSRMSLPVNSGLVMLGSDRAGKKVGNIGSATMGIPFKHKNSTAVAVKAATTKKAQLLTKPHKNLETGASRFRIAAPSISSAKANGERVGSATSNQFWNQVSKQIGTKKDFTIDSADQRVLASDSRSGKSPSQLLLDQQRMTYQVKGAQKDPLASKPFSFLSNIGGKETTQARMTLKTGEKLQDIVDAVNEQSESQGVVKADNLIIYTNMSVDQRDQFRGKRTVYLQGAQTSKFGKAQKLSAHEHPFAQTSKFQKVTRLDPLIQKSVGAVSRGQTSQAYLESIDNRPASSLSKQGSQSKFRGTKKDFKISSSTQRPYSVSGSSMQQSRPMSGMPRQTSSQNIGAMKTSNDFHQTEKQDSVYDFIKSDHIDEVDDENDITMEGRKDDEISTFCKQIMKARPTTALVNEIEAQDTLPYPELFDRSERTFAATFARYGDLSYFTPVQRIGGYMEHNARLKRKHLMDLIAYLKTSKATIKVDEDGEGPGGKQAAADFVENCLFIGLMQDENKQKAPVEAQLTYEIPYVTFQNHMIGLGKQEAYDPLSARTRQDLNIEKIWSKALLKQVQISIHRMLKYIESPDSIRPQELSKYRKEWMQRSLDLVSDHLLTSFPDVVRDLFQQIFESYIRAMKTAIMDYILKSPDERKRLHILMPPKRALTAAEKQVRSGGYSVVMFPGTHKRKIGSENEIKFKLITNNIVVSKLKSWWHEFREFKLVDLQNFSHIVQSRNVQFGQNLFVQPDTKSKRSTMNQSEAEIGTCYALDIDNFLNFQEAVLEKTLAVMKNIWFRGAVLIIKKFKQLQSKEQQEPIITGKAAESKWTFEGFNHYNNHDLIADIGVSNQIVSQIRNFTYKGGKTQQTKMSPLQEYCMRTAALHSNVHLKVFRQDQRFMFNSVIEDLQEDTTLDNLVDIRDNSAYIAFVSMIGGYINFEENGYEGLAKEYKRELKYAAGNLIRLQLRQLIDESVTTFSNFFKGFRSYAQLKKSQANFTPLREIRTFVTVVRERVKEEPKAQTAKRKKEEENPIYLAQLKRRKEEAERAMQQSPRSEADSLSALYDKPPKLDVPDFMDLQDYANPIFHLELLLGNFEEIEQEKKSGLASFQLCEQLVFNKSDEQILNDFEAFFDDMVTSFNDFCRPEFCKIQVYSQKKYEVDQKEQEATRRMQLHHKRNHRRRQKQKDEFSAISKAVKSGVFPPQYANIILPQKIDFDQLLYNGNHDGPFSYEKYMGRIKCKESPSEIMTKDLFDHKHGYRGNDNNVFARDSVQKFMHVATPGEDYFRHHKAVILSVLREHLKEVKRVIEVYEQFKPVIRNELHKRVTSFLGQRGSALERMADYAALLKELRYYQKLVRHLPERVAFPMFEVGTALVKIELKKRIENLIYDVLKKFEDDLLLRTQENCAIFEKIENDLALQLTTAEEVVEMDQYKNKLIVQMTTLMRTLAFHRKCVFFLLTQNDMPNIFNQPNEESGRFLQGQCYAAVQELDAWPKKLDDIMDIADTRHRQERDYVESIVSDRKNHLDKGIELMQGKIQELAQWKDFNKYKYEMQKVYQMQQELEYLEQEKQEIVTQENLLFGYKSDFPKLTHVSRMFDPYFELWTRIEKMMSRKQHWKESFLNEIDSDEVDQLIKDSTRSLHKLQKLFHDDTEVKNILMHMNSEIIGLRSWMPKIEVLCSKALKSHHWHNIQKIIGVMTLDPATTQLSMIVALEIDEHILELQEISEKAKKQDRLEEMLKSMEREWHLKEFEITTFRDTHIPILSGAKVEEYQLMLDEHVLISQTIRNSPDVTPIIERAGAWERTMVFTQEVLEVWTKLQANYLYLYPIFNTVGLQEEVKSLLNAEEFGQVDKTWRNIMFHLRQDPVVLNLNRIRNLELQLKQADQQLEHIQKNLNEYLESKRKYFSRFYFLSNEDLIEILGDSQKPRRIQKHLKKCFEGINEVTFKNPTIQQNIGIQQAIEDPQKDEITQLVSKEGEIVDLVETIFPMEYDGKVEEWLFELEKQMKTSIKKVIVESIRDYPGNTIIETKKRSKGASQDRTQWLSRWQSQVVIVISQIMWTHQVETALNNLDHSRTEILMVYRNCQKMLAKIVDMVREKLPDLLRLTLSGLIVIEVHARDVVEGLCRKEVSNTNDFEWISQLRYYFIGQEQKVEARMVVTKQNYCNEYLGNTSRLVITPLTDRCYRTLMSALDLNLGGAPEGPAGTGKTETTKDLAKAVAVHCMVFNCAEGLNSRAMAKFFKGLASGGSWSCFDEFNRIELEVLSVIAQQILEIQRAKNQGLTRFMFEETEISLLPTANIFITMNPGYAGRAELPDNLKALFRPVAMMVPDYAMIAEISLYSYGFHESRSLAKKIETTYRLCSEQLSSQYHYDYGMRAVKAVLTAAKNLKYQSTRRQNTSLTTRSEHFTSKELTEDSAAPDDPELRKIQKELNRDKEESEEMLILRSIRDVNLPKFLADDIPLFIGIVNDLFQGLDLPDTSYPTLQQTTEKVMQHLNLQSVPSFVEKVIQLYDMIKCRHGLMLVGPANSGKTTTYKVLQRALTEAARTDSSLEEKPVETFVLNPKSITLPQLYGSYDLISQEFTDGILGSIFRHCAYKDANMSRRWMIFDGPVDAEWIENMNTVLDDNKKLCLMNGEIIQMSESMNLIFETHDLSQASPATVSRCGMVYLAQESFGGWRTLLNSWLNLVEQNPEVIKMKIENGPQLIIERIKKLFKFVFGSLLEKVFKECSFIIQAQEAQLTSSTLKIMTLLFQKRDFHQLIHREKIKAEDIEQRIDIYFQYAIIWSVGAITDEAGKKSFQSIFREFIAKIYKIDKKQFRVERSSYVPDQGQNIFNYFVGDAGLWISYKDVLQRAEFNTEMDREASFNELIIPTTENLKQNQLLQMFVTQGGQPVLFVGPTGTGKSVAVQKYIRQLPKESYMTATICFSAKSSANFTQESIENKLEKRGRRVYGPQVGKKLLVFVDDLNMPTVSQYGAQPPIELLRQFMDHKAWYNYKDKGNPLFTVNDVQFIAAMCPPSGGKNQVTPRFLRHFNVVSTNNFDEQVLLRIFNKLMDWHIKTCNIMGTESAKVLKGIVAGTIDVFKFVQLNLRPTPAKSHYLFNLRDLSRVVQGVQMMKTFQHSRTIKLIRLWVHEIGRVFSDRLITTSDQQMLFNHLFESARDKVKENLTTALRDLVPEGHILEEDELPPEKTHETMVNKIIFSDLASIDHSGGVRALSDSREYNEVGINERAELKSKLEESLDNYNSFSKKPMDLVLFDFAVMHLTRICRVLKMRDGNCLLIGLGGSGRQSLAQLSAFVMDQAMIQPEQTKSYNYDSWSDDMKRLLMTAGAEEKTCSFFLNDSQLKFSFMLEDVNNLLNQGEIPNLFGTDDKINITERSRLNAKKDGLYDLYNTGSTDDLLDFFVHKVKKHLHIVLAMSPTGSTLRNRIRNFPSLVNCCTIDWFTSWPKEALEAVANKYLEDTPFEDKLKQNIVKMCNMFHTDTIELGEVFWKEQKRKTYVTPTSYLDLNQMFMKLLEQQRNKLYDKKLSYEMGINKLKQTSEQVAVMQQELNDKQPKLEQMEEETDNLMIQINKESTEIVEPRKKEIQKQEIAANAVMMEAQAIKIECENDLEKAMPIIKQAQAALNTIKPAHINEIKALGKPPNAIKVVLQAVCIMCSRPVEKTPKKDNPKFLEENWWYTAQKFMTEKDFIQQLLNFDKENIKEEIIQRIKKDFLSDPDFKPNRVSKASQAAKGLCEWVIKLEQYDQLVRYIKPKRKALSDAQYKYSLRMADLNEKQDELRNVVMQFETLQNKLAESSKTKAKLAEDIKDCTVRLERAKILLEGLGGEQTRWAASLEQVEENLKTIVPDMLLSAGLISYLGSFTQIYRNQTVQNWLYQMNAFGLTTTSNFSLENVLGEKVLIRQWHMTGLPSDSFSVENGIIMSQSMKWPLCIDPQSQVNRWIKSMEITLAQQKNSGNKLVIVKPSDPDFVQRFEQSIRMGLPLLLESVGEDLDPILEPVLLRQVFKIGGFKQIKFGDDKIDYADDFRLYMTTRYANPHYLPELSTKVSLINFMITFEGLREQLLNLVVKKENVQLDDERAKLIVSQYENNKQQKETEAIILKVLKEATGNILDDEKAIIVLNQSQQLSDEIKKKQLEALETEKRLEEAREVYIPIANHAALLFFLVSKLHLVEVMYQYSLSWFIQLFSLAVDNSRDKSKLHPDDSSFNISGNPLNLSRNNQQSLADKDKSVEKQDDLKSPQDSYHTSIDLQERVDSLISFFTYALYSNVCRSIFEKDKLLFSFLLTAKIRQSQGKMTQTQYNMLSETMTGIDNPLRMPNPAKSWLPNSVWNKLCTYAYKDQLFDSLVKNFYIYEGQWKMLYDCEVLTEDLYPKNETSITGTWTPFMKLCILKAMRPDKLSQAVQEYVYSEMGQRFLSPPIFDIEESFADSTCATPLIFILPGTDPLQQLTQFAQSKKKFETMKSISLGQGQGPRAEKAILEARKYGSWVLLQNCHLYPSWMSKLEQICEQMEMKATPGAIRDHSHPSFRLWLTSYPSDIFPTPVLQNGIKMTNEPPIGLKANMVGSYKVEPLSKSEFFNGNKDSATFKKLAFSLTMFHAILLQRKNFGPLGWNISYGFTVSDLSISMKQLYFFVDQYARVPFNALSYLIGECNYGGRVTDENDRKLLAALLEDFMSDKILDYGYSSFNIEDSSCYIMPDGNNPYHTYIEKIQSMPNDEQPQVFGFHPNADITKNINQANTLLTQILKIGEVEGVKQLHAELDKNSAFTSMLTSLTPQRRRESSIRQPQTKEKSLITMCDEILSKLPEREFDVETLQIIFPVKRENSMNTVLVQEVCRFNRLLSIIIKSLNDIKLADAGEIILSEQLQKTMNSIELGHVPDSWKAVSYPSLKPLASYIKDLVLRLETLNVWIRKESPPEVFWLSGFFFTQSFLTAILQNYARKHSIEIDRLTFEFKFLHDEDPFDYTEEVFEIEKAKAKNFKIQPPPEGAYISGLYFEGARWNYERNSIDEQLPKQLYSRVPIIWLLPQIVQTHDPSTLGTMASPISAQPIINPYQSQSTNKQPTSVTSLSDKSKSQVESVTARRDIGERIFKCPLYKTAERKGTLLTTGHSTNFIMYVNTPVKVIEGKDTSHWIKRGAAMLTQLSD